MVVNVNTNRSCYLIMPHPVLTMRFQQLFWGKVFSKPDYINKFLYCHFSNWQSFYSISFSFIAMSVKPTRMLSIVSSKREIYHIPEAKLTNSLKIIKNRVIFLVCWMRQQKEGGWWKWRNEGAILCNTANWVLCAAS